VRSAGDVFLETAPLLTDLLSYLAPQREEPLPFPDTNLALTARFGESPSGQAELSARSGSGTAKGRLDLSGGRTELSAGGTRLFATAAHNRDEHTVDVTVGAPGQRAGQAELAMTLPAGWWVVVARDMTGKWDRVNDPIREFRLADGRLRLTFSFRPGDDAVYLSVRLARLAVNTL